MIRTLAPWLAAVLVASCVPPPTTPLGVTIVHQAPAGVFSSTMTFDLRPTFANVAIGRDEETLAALKVDFERGCSKAEHEFRRDPFLTNPLLANRRVPPNHVVAVSVDVLDSRGPFLRISGALRVVDLKGNVVEEAAVGASVNRHGAESEADAVAELGYVTGVYMVCRTGEHPDRCGS